MKITAITFRLHAPWVHSLKEKRMIVKSRLAKQQNRFHVSAVFYQKSVDRATLLNRSSKNGQ